MFRKLLLIMFICVLTYPPSLTNAEGVKNIELFEIEKDSVTNVIPVSEQYQQLAESYLKNISGIYVKVRPIPTTGYMIKVPLEPSVHVKNEWMDSLVDEIIIIFAKNEEPYLMLFDDENNPHFLHFKGNVKPFINTFQINI
jgi:hypothetical protein